MGYQKATAPLTLPVALPDLPKVVPVPAITAADVAQAVGVHCSGLNGKLDTLLERTAPKVTGKRTSARGVK